MAFQFIPEGSSKPLVNATELPNEPPMTEEQRRVYMEKEKALVDQNDIDAEAGKLGKVKTITVTPGYAPQKPK